MSALAIVSAVAFEASPTIEALEKKGVKVDFYEIGIGPLNALKGTLAILDDLKDRDILYIGSCGTFGRFDGPFMIQADKAFWMPPCHRTGIAACIENLHQPIIISNHKLKKIEGLPLKSVLTSPTISLSGSIDEKLDLPAPDFLVENMELYCFLNEALSVINSVSIVLGVTNQIGPEGRIQWRKNFKCISQLTADYIAEKL